MRELSLHILDIAQNSIVAEAREIRIAIIEDLVGDRLTIRIKDDGCGMDEATLQKVIDPFYTTRTTRKIGLGIPMFKANAESCNGNFMIRSELGMGTEIDAEFQHSHIDRVPLGNMAETLITIIQANINIDLIYTHSFNEKKFTLNTKDIKKTLGDLPINNMDVLLWLRGYINEALEEIRH
ncbi:MAG: sensor histidine kinase [Clostridia bacterium]|nr:sensor histidine kinase [Clostridia bacterium]